jgi:signal transduction histidine kinase
MRPLSLRARVTLWFIGVVMLLLGGFSFTLYTRLRLALREGVDAALAARAEALLGACEWDEEIDDVEFKPSPQVTADFEAGHPGRGLEIWSGSSHKQLHHSGDAIPGELPARTLPDDVDRAATLTDVEGDPHRRLCTLLARLPAVPAHDEDPDRPACEVTVRITESLADVAAQLGRVSWQTLALIGGAWLVVLAFGIFLSRHFVRPLHRLIAAADAVRPGERAAMPRSGNGDELDQLAAVLDRTFASLEESLDRQTRFTANAAHELRSPVAVIRNAAEVALRHERTGDDYRRFLADALAASLQVGRMIEALLQLARLDAKAAQATFRDVDLAQVAREAAAALEPGGGAIRVANGAAAAVRGEPGLLRVLVDNLLDNACRYRDGKSVEVEVGADGSGHVALRVRNFGPGVPDADRPHLFERFYRVNDRQERGDRQNGHDGAGLGLAIVADIARLHGARCGVEDAAPGTRVVVAFPAPPAAS